MEERFRVYVANKQEWEKACRENFLKEGNPGVKRVENAIVEPLRPYQEDYSTLYSGGGMQ